MAKSQSLVMAGRICDDSVFFFIEHKQKINSYSSKQIITTKLDTKILKMNQKNKTLSQWQYINYN